MNRRGGKKVEYHLKATDLKPLGHQQEAIIAHSNSPGLPPAPPLPHHVAKMAKKVAAPHPKNKKKPRRATAAKPKKARRTTPRRKPAKPAKRVAHKKPAKKTTPKAVEEEEEDEE